ncbi:hypothetical protein [Nevskia ramosa]|uniref:hypothetical protein n=1 Tax=Nevskia ramosa TaxID=64002 RepID=UPI003D10E1B2
MAAEVPKILTLKLRDRSWIGVIEWPIIERRPQAILVETDGGRIWLRLRDFCNPVWPVEGQERLISLLEDVTRTGGDAQAPVQGPLKAAASNPKKGNRKYLVEVRPRPRIIHSNPFVADTSWCQVTLPDSLVTGKKGNLLSPLWVIKKQLGNDVEFVGATWPGMEAVKNEVRQAAHRATTARNAAEALAQRNQNALNEATAQHEAAENAKRARIEALNEKGIVEALAYCHKKFSLSDLVAAGVLINDWPKWPTRTEDGLQSAEQIVRFVSENPAFERWKAKRLAREATKVVVKRQAKAPAPDRVLEGVTVQWVSWDSRRRNFKPTEHKASNCHVMIFGSKHVITTPDGQVVTKMKGPKLIIR